MKSRRRFVSKMRDANSGFWRSLLRQSAHARKETANPPSEAEHPESCPAHEQRCGSDSCSSCESF
jgi:hypothetical protein